MKIAILHSNLNRIGGDVTFVYELARELNSRIYVNSYDEKISEVYKDLDRYVVPTNITIKYPKGAQAYEHIIRFMLKRDINADFHIYSGEWPAYRVIVDKTPYLYYCHTPNRVLYDLKSYTLGDVKKRNLIYKLMYGVKIKTTTFFDQLLHRNFINPKQAVTNSKLVYNRYIQVYNKTPRTIIHPPIDTSKFYNKPSENYYLTVSRLARYKQIDWQIKAFSRTNEKLVIAGEGEDKKRLERLAKEYKSTVVFKGMVSDKELKDLYARSKAFIFSAIDEDFGITPLEALASGKPVLSINEGGPMEYLTNENSLLFKNIKELRELIHRYTLEDFESMKDACLKTAEMFDTREVGKQTKKIIRSILEEFYNV